MKKSIFIILILMLNINCNDNPVGGKPENRSPVILSLTVFPDAIGPSDSAIVICNAYDPDGDTLVYDWFSDSRIKIEGAFGDQDWLYNTFENSRILYPKNVNTPIDTPWIQCFARDRKGKSDSRIVHFFVRQEKRGN